MNTLSRKNNDITAAPESTKHTKGDSGIDLEGGYDGGASDSSEAEAYQGSPPDSLAASITSIFFHFGYVLELGSYETAVSFLERVKDKKREEYNAIEDLRRETSEEENLKHIQAAGIITAAVRLFTSIKDTQNMPDYPPKHQNIIETEFREKEKFQKGILHKVPVPDMQQKIHRYIKAKWEALGTEWLANAP
ncbi:hypothetical protein TWF718_009675 [Orbilia javanica]|uniref:Uncharacterized protein n=1 Tax=Orbilia javanica TaxID=47235 RepID=A0AAN8MSW2_9PEZI